MMTEAKTASFPCKPKEIKGLQKTEARARGKEKIYLGSQKDHDLADTLNSDIQPLELWGNTSPLL